MLGLVATMSDNVAVAMIADEEQSQQRLYSATLKDRGLSCSFHRPRLSVLESLHDCSVVGGRTMDVQWQGQQTHS